MRGIHVIGGRIERNLVDSLQFSLGSLLMIRDLKVNYICVNFSAKCAEFV